MDSKLPLANNLEDWVRRLSLRNPFKTIVFRSVSHRNRKTAYLGGVVTMACGCIRGLITEVSTYLEEIFVADFVLVLGKGASIQRLEYISSCDLYSHH